MYDYCYVGKIPLQASTNGDYKLTIHFQQKMNNLFHGFEFIRAYIDYMLIITKEYWTNHIQKL